VLLFFSGAPNIPSWPSATWFSSGTVAPARTSSTSGVTDLTPELWEQVYFAATRRQTDKDDAAIEVAEGRVARHLYRIVYEVLGDLRIRPIEIFPITGFPINRRELDR